MTSLPGRTLQRIAARIAPPATCERVLLPLIADLQFEHSRARSPWERARARLRSLIAFWTAQTAALTGTIVLGSTFDEIDSTRRRVAQEAWSTAAIGLVMVLLGAWQMRGLGLGLGLVGGFVLPSMASAAIPLGVLFATALAGPVTDRAQEHAVRRTGIATGLVTFAIVAWLTPLANQEYRERTFQLVTKNTVRHPLARGTRELTLGGLSARTAELRASGRTSEIPPLEVEWHKKPAIGASCFALALLGAAIAATGWRPLLRGAAALVFATGIFLALSSAERAADAGRLTPALAMWLPFVSCAVFGFALLRVARVPRATAAV